MDGNFESSKTGKRCDVDFFLALTILFILPVVLTALYTVVLVNDAVFGTE